MSAVLFSAGVAVAFIGLGRWGMRNLDELVPVRGSAEKQGKDLRSLRRGARSCLVLGVLFAAFSLVQGTTLLAGGG